jgi:hypothetical protein
MFDSSWRLRERIIVERAIERHGGAAWRDLGTISSTVAIDGLLPRMKRAREMMRQPRTVTVDVHAGRTVFCDFPTAGSTAATCASSAVRASWRAAVTGGRSLRSAASCSMPRTSSDMPSRAT